MALSTENISPGAASVWAPELMAAPRLIQNLSLCVAHASTHEVALLEIPDINERHEVSYDEHAHINR